MVNVSIFKVCQRLVTVHLSLVSLRDSKLRTVLPPHWPQYNTWPFPRLSGVATQTGNVVCKSKGNNYGSEIQIEFKWNYTRKSWPERQENPVTPSEEFNTDYLVNIEDESVFDRKDGFVPAEVTNKKLHIKQSSVVFQDTETTSVLY